MNTQTEPPHVVEEYLDAYNERDIERITSVLAEEIASEGTTVTRDGLIEAIKAYWAGFSDCQHSVDRYVCEGDYVTVRTVFFGTHDGEFHGIPPSGAEFEVTEFMMLHVNEGEIDGYWYAWDELGFWKQLGLLDHPLQ